MISGTDTAEVIAQIPKRPARVVVALLEQMSPPCVAEALRDGATAVADWDAPPEEIVMVVEHAIEGRTIVPAVVARWMANEATVRAVAPPITSEELEWVRLLSTGHTVIGLSSEFGYSERAMFRRLAALYRRLGAANRDEAMVAAERFGLLA
jgi:DNA-binding NarL/FixJ family response regulator